MNFISGVTFKQATEKSVNYSFSKDLNLKFIHLLDLAANKMLTGRLKDFADIEELQRIHVQLKGQNILSKIKKLLKK
jgi:hypothetical protein